jgi:hypothetical protein
MWCHVGRVTSALPNRVAAHGGGGGACLGYNQEIDQRSMSNCNQHSPYSPLSALLSVRTRSPAVAWDAAADCRVHSSFQLAQFR